MARIDLFEMERMQSLHWYAVEYDLSESGVAPLEVGELLDGDLTAAALLDTKLGYPRSEGSPESRERIAAWYPGATDANVTLTNGGSEANHLTLWTLLEPGDRLAFMIPNYLQGLGLGRHLAEATDTFRLEPRGDTWALDVDSLEAAVGERTRAIMVCNPNNPTGHVLSEPEMDAVVAAAERVGAWIVADEIYRGAELDTDEATPTFWGRSERVIVTSGLSKAFAMPGLRVGWVVAPEELVHEIWVRHDYTTLTPGILGDRFCASVMEPERRERILSRTRSIVRANHPRLEAWLATRPELRSIRPKAGAIAYAEYDLPVRSRDLIERIRVDHGVLLVPGEMFGLGDGFRIGFGFDIEHTIKGLELAAASFER